MTTIAYCDSELLTYAECPCDTPPTISAPAITVEVGQEFDPLQDVEAFDCAGSPVTVTVTEVNNG